MLKDQRERHTIRSVGKRPAAFLDRDGTINVDVGYLSNPTELALLPGAASAVQAFNQAGWYVIVVSNQSGIGRGFFDVQALEAINQRLKAELATAGAQIDALYHCPHLPDSGCACRKPGIGMIEQASATFAIDISRSWVIGDRRSDVELGQAAGCRTALISHDDSQVPILEPQPDLIVASLAEAAEQILGQRTKSRTHAALSKSPGRSGQSQGT